jgi:hypothetical protein
MRSPLYRLASVGVAVLLAAPPVNLQSAPVTGTVQGTVTVSGRPVSGLLLALVDLDTGIIYRATSGDAGAFHVQVAPGDYIITGGGPSGLAVGKGPTRLSVASGQVASAQLDLVALPVVAPAPTLTRVASNSKQETPQEPPPLEPAPPTEAAVDATTINHEPVGCFIAGQFPLLDAAIAPSESVARARVYFKAAGGTDWFFVEMTPQEGKFFGKLPRPKIEASPITYYIQATTTQFGEAQTSEVEGIVVAEEKDCGDRKVAAIGPAGPVQVFSAASGAAIAPAGFAAGGLAAAGALIAVLGGAAAIGIGAVIITRPTPTPTPTAVPTPGPTPTPTPTPGPTPTPSPSPLPSPPPSSPLR